MPIGPIPAVPANLPGIPSPATGVPSGGDLFTGLLGAVPSFQQGQQEREQMKEIRRKRALEELQQLAPYAAQDAKNPATIKAVQKAFKHLGMDPAAALNQDGTLNTNALIQYNPYFGTFSELIKNPNVSPSIVKYFADKVGLKDMPDMGTYTAKELDAKVAQFAKNKQLVGAGKYDPKALVVDAQSLQGPLQQAGRGLEAQDILTQAMNAAPGALTAANIRSTGASADVKQQQLKFIIAQTLEAQAKVGLIKAQTVEAAHKVGLIDAQTYAAYQHVAIAAKNAETQAARLQVEMSRVNSTNLSTALKAVTDYNSSVHQIQGNIDSLTGQLTNLQNNGQLMIKNPQAGQPGPDGKPQPDRVLSPTASLITGQLNHLRDLQGKLKPVNPQDVTNAALHNAGLPSTQKILPNSQPPATKSVSRKDLVAIARKYKKSLNQVTKDYESQGYTVNP